MNVQQCHISGITKKRIVKKLKPSGRRALVGGLAPVSPFVSQRYINHASVLCIVAACTCVYPKNIALGQVVTQIVGHVDTVWDTTTSVYQNNIKVNICNYSGSNALELITIQSKKFNNVADLRNNTIKAS